MNASVSLASSGGYAGDVERRCGGAGILQGRSAVETPATAGQAAKSRPPPMIDFSSTSGDGTQHHHHHHHHKRRKVHHNHSSLAETTYESTTVWKDLERGGLTAQKVTCIKDFTFPFLPPHIKIDTSRVELVTSNNYQSKEEDSASSKLQADQYTNTAALSALFGECHAYYKSAMSTPVSVDSTAQNAKPANSQGALTQQNLQPNRCTSSSRRSNSNDAGRNNNNTNTTTSNDSESSTSSMTDSSDDGNSPEETTVGSTSGDNNVANVSPPKGYIRMGDALANSKVPRYVGREPLAGMFCSRSFFSSASNTYTLIVVQSLSLIALSFSPFVVVHVNSPFTRLTGQRSIHVLGRPLHGTFLQDPVISAALQTCCPQFTLGSLDGQAIRMGSTSSPSPSSSSSDSASASDSSSSSSSSSSHRRSKQCTVRVQPIGQEGPSQNITHYLLELVPVGEEIVPGEGADDNDVDNNDGQNAGLCVNVMG